MVNIMLNTDSVDSLWPNHMAAALSIRVNIIPDSGLFPDGTKAFTWTNAELSTENVDGLVQERQ